MFRDYKKGDELLLNSNHFSHGDDMSIHLETRNWKFKTFQKGNDILVIFGYLQYVKDHYAVYSMVSRDITLSQLREMKREVEKAARKIGAKTFLTFCNKDGKLDRWHKFMGFVNDRSTLFGKTKNMTRWILKWQQQQ